MDELFDAPAPAAEIVPATSPFGRFGDRDVLDLIAEFPLAWVCGAGGGLSQPALLPLLSETDGDGRLLALIGHMARHNPLHAALRADPRCLLLFTGPHAYVSPELVGDRQWAPTWNYAQLRVAGELRFGDTAAAVSALVGTMEAVRADPWRIEDMGPRYEVLEKAIVGFRVPVDRIDGRFKLGQDEPPETVRRIIAGHPDADLVRWMRRFNATRI